MAFYVAKGLQIAGLAGGGVALYAGLSGSTVRELSVALLSVGLFYLGRRIEP